MSTFTAEIAEKKGKRKTAAAAPIEPYKRMVLLSADQAKVRAVDWIIPGWLPEGFLTLVSGDGRAGKSSLIYSIMSDMSRGDCCMGMSYPNPVIAKTIYVGVEDDIESKIKPFLVTRDADLSKIIFHAHTLDQDEKATSFSLAEVDAIRHAARETGAKLIVFDPASAFLPRGVDDNSDTEVRSVLGPLAELSRDERIGMKMVKHTGKGSGRKATAAHLGSAAWRNACRAAWLILRDDDAEHERVLFDVGSSLCKENAPLRYRTASPEQDRLNALWHDKSFAGLPDEDRKKLMAQLYEVHFMGETQANADDMMARPAAGAVTHGDSLACADWLRKRLGKGVAWVDKDIQQEAKGLGYSPRQYESAKTRLRTEGLQSKAREARGRWYVAFGDPTEAPMGKEIPD